MEEEKKAYPSITISTAFICLTASSTHSGVLKFHPQQPVLLSHYLLLFSKLKQNFQHTPICQTQMSMRKLRTEICLSVFVMTSKSSIFFQQLSSSTHSNLTTCFRLQDKTNTELSQRDAKSCPSSWFAWQEIRSYGEHALLRSRYLYKLCII